MLLSANVLKFRILAVSAFVIVFAMVNLSGAMAGGNSMGPVERTGKKATTNTDAGMDAELGALSNKGSTTSEKSDVELEAERLSKEAHLSDVLTQLEADHFFETADEATQQSIDDGLLEQQLSE